MPPEAARTLAGIAAAPIARAPTAQPIPLLVVTALLWSNTAHFIGECLATGTSTAVLAPPGHRAHALPGTALRLALPLLRPQRAIERAILRCRPGLIIAGDDCAAGFLRKLHTTTPHPQVRAVIARSLGDPVHYPLLDNRMAVNRVAQTQGLAVPAARDVPQRSNLAAAIGEVGLPAYVKRDGTWGGNGAIRASSVPAAHGAWRTIAVACSPLRAALRALRRRRRLVPMRSPGSDRWLVQRAVEGDHVIASAVCWRGRVLAHAIGRVVERRHPTGPATTFSPVADPALLAQIARLVRALGLSGPIGVDFIIDAAGTAHFIELNARLTPLGTIGDTGGGDQLCALLHAALGTLRLRPAPLPQAVVAMPT